MMKFQLQLFFYCLVIAVSPLFGADNFSFETAEVAVRNSVRFYRENVSINGGSVFRVSDDLKLREGENRVGPREAWIETPATSAVGRAYLQCWQLTRDPIFYDAMLEVADGLIRGQLVSGGWTENIEFDPLLRPQYAYRADHRTDISKLKNRTTFDDNKSQSSLLFLMLVDQELEFKNERIHEAVMYGLNSFSKVQYPNGAWPQQFVEATESETTDLKKASFPKSWSREYQKISYTRFYTLNDGTVVDLIEMMLIAHEIYDDQRWLDSAMRGGDFLLLAQLPEPQPGWAQQYNENMQPEWARKFEPPAITGGESQGVINMLLTLYERTGEQKYFQPVRRAIDYYQSLLLPDGRLARFYEMGTNRPLYFARSYDLVYSDDDLPTHYGFQVSSKLERLQDRYEKIRERGPKKSSLIRKISAPKLNEKLRMQAAETIKALDKRGAWVENGKMQEYPESQQSGEIISTQTYSKNILLLAEFIAASKK